MQVFPETRYHRCAVYAWGALQGAQAPTVPPAARLVLPKSMALNDQFAAWHEAAEAFCQRAVREGLATVERKAERPKGSRATTRPVAEPKRCCELETVELRRWRRLYRSAAEQERRRGSAAQLTPDQCRHWSRVGGVLPAC